MATFNKSVFATTLDSNAMPPNGSGHSDLVIASALNAAGLSTAGQPTNPKDWGSMLVRLGFQVVATSNSFYNNVGDIAVLQGTSSNAAGSVQGFDGRNWVSDFIQYDFWPSAAARSEQPASVLYRWPF